MTKEELIKELLGFGYLKTPLYVEAFRAIDRKDFVPEDMKEEAYWNSALPIGFGQTISQPGVVALMLEYLEPKPGQKILDIGSGSGWTTTLLAYIVSQPQIGADFTRNNAEGRVFAIERIPELKEFGEKNCAKYDFVKSGVAKFIGADGSKGLVKQAPFDRIQIAAASRDMPETLKKQLAIGGKLIVPVVRSADFFGDIMYLITRESENKFKEEELPGLFAFVPLIGE